MNGSLIALRERISKALWDAGDTAKADEALMELWGRAERLQAQVDEWKVRCRSNDYREVLRRIADWPDDNMATAKTLHYDMRGWAREALDA